MDARLDVVVIGGGHAGCEAAAAAARMGAATALVTHRFSTIGAMSCNPAIGGLGKGHLVREIDALDGLMGRVADRGGIQFRVLNRRKGPAVRGPRAQADRALYAAAMQQALLETPGLSVIEGEVDNLTIVDGRASGVTLTDGRALRRRRGRPHDRHVSARPDPHRRAANPGRPRRRGAGAGPVRYACEARLSARTPEDRHAATARRSDDRLGAWSRCSRATSRRSRSPSSPTRIDQPQVHCGITRTTPGNARHHPRQLCIARRSIPARFQSRGPRYCPSIEDKIVRFGERDGHQIFLEPEGLDDDTVYPNGISTSLPEDVQLAVARHHSGARNARDDAAGLCHRIRLCRSARAQADAGDEASPVGYSWPARSMARRATRRPPHRAWWLGSTRPRGPAVATESCSIAPKPISA